MQALIFRAFLFFTFKIQFIKFVKIKCRPLKKILTRARGNELKLKYKKGRLYFENFLKY